MIRSFANTSTQTEHIWNGERSKHIPANLGSRALAKLRMLNRPRNLEDLRNPPGNRLHLLEGDRQGQYSISVNDQFRLCFRFADGDAYDVEFCDYH